VTAAVGAGMVVLFNLVASLIARRSQVSYRRFVAGSFAIYAVTGGTAVAFGGLPGAALAGMAVAFAEATLGWAVSWWLGPGRPPAELRNASSVSAAIVLIIFTGAAVGALGGALRRGLE
jgi:hypothetical protein